jgi:hypothetical protein
MKRMLTLVLLMLLSVASFAHVWEIRVNQNQNGTLTWYLQSYHGVGECGIGSSGLVINGVQYATTAIFSGDISTLSPNVFAVNQSYNSSGNRQSYATMTTPFLGTTLSVFPYSNNVCWDNLVSGTGNFTPPPPPVCTSCPITSWSNTTGTPNNNGTACDPTDDKLPVTITVNHLSCGNITGDSVFNVVFDPSGANVNYGPFHYAAGITTTVSINVPYGTSNSTQVNVNDADFPCNIAHGLTIPGGSFQGVPDVTPPVLNCPANITVNAGQGQCGANVTYTVTATDNCTANPTITYSQNSGTLFPVGTTTVNVSAKDANNNMSNCSFTVTVIDNQAPIITGPQNITVNADAGQCGANVQVPTAGGIISCLSGWANTLPIQVTSTNATALTNYQVKVVLNTQQYISAGSMQANGADIRFNDANCTPLNYWIESGINTTNTIIWVKVPSIPANGSTTITMNYGNAAATAMSSGTNTFIVFDDFESGTTAGWSFGSGTWAVTNVGGNKVLSLSNPGTGSGAPAVRLASLPSNAYVVETDYFPITGGSYAGPLFEYNDFNNYYAIHTMPNTSQVMHSLITGGSPNYSLAWTYAHAAAQWYNFRVERSGSANNVYFNQSFIVSLGTHFSDGAGLWGWGGNSNFDNFRVREYAAVVPAVTIGTGSTFVVSDNCNIGSIVNNHNGTNNASGFYPVGTTTVNWTVTDVNGNTSTASQTITVNDNQNPTITAPANVTVNADNGVCRATGVALGTPVTGDNCAVASTTNNGPSSYPVGTTTVTWTVTDIHGNSKTATQTITVVDNQAPSITAPANVTVNANSGSCAATNVSLGTPATADNCGVASVTNNGSFSYPVGTTTVTWTVTDIHGNSSTATQTVTVVDNQAPSITAPADVTVNADNGSCAATNVDLGNATTGDNCGVASTTNDALSSYPVGTTTVTWTVTDIHGNSSTATQTVTVVDNQAPSITAPSAITVNADNGVCNAAVDLGSATTGDNCGVASVTNNGSSPYPVGTTTVIWTVTDIHGNSSTATQTITVIDNQAPSITAPADVTVNADNGSCAATNVSLGDATTGDNCGVASTTNDGLSSYPVGATTVTWTVTDIHGNSSTATQTVTVVDNQAPSITAPSAITVNADNGVCNAAVDLGSATTGDNCGVASVTNNGSSPYPVGTTTVTWTVTDIHGNSSTATQTVTVIDNQNPSAVCQAYTLNLSNGSGSITAANVDGGSTDNCGIASMSVSPNTFTCANAGANTVTLTVTDIHGNVSTCQATVTVQYQPTCTISVTPSNNTYTGGVVTNLYLGYGPQSATITANPVGGAGFTYVWTGTNTSKLSCTNCQNPVFTPTAGGTYTYTVTATNSNGCSTSCQVSFCVKDIRDGISNNPNSQKVFICHVPPGNSGNPNTLSISVNAVPSHLGLHSGDRLGKCDQTCGGNKGGDMEEHLEAGELKVYPNPTTGMFVVELPGDVKGGQAVILDMQGKVVDQKTFLPDSKLTFDLGSVAKGVYLIQVMNGDNIYRSRVVVQ